MAQADLFAGSPAPRVSDEPAASDRAFAAAARMAGAALVNCMLARS